MQKIRSKTQKTEQWQVLWAKTGRKTFYDDDSDVECIIASAVSAQGPQICHTFWAK